MEWGKNVDTSFIRAAQLALNSIGNNYSYAFLMGISGAAFRFHFHPDWCPSAAGVTTGFDVSKVLFKSLGYTCRLRAINDSRLEEVKNLYKAIIAQINRGFPIVAINLKVCPEWGIISGYLKNRPGIICRTFFDESDEYSMADHAPWLSFFMEERGEVTENAVLYRDSLSLAVRLSETDAFEKYLSGFNAFEKWIGELNLFLSRPKNCPFEEHEVNLTLAGRLLDSRRAAVEYLEIINSGSPLANGRSIITNYKKEVALLEDLIRNTLPSFDSGPDIWNPEIIRVQVDTISQVLEMEKETIGFIEQELKSFVY